MSFEQYNEVMKTLKNHEYLAKLDKSMKQFEEGKVVVKTIEELDEMVNE